ncbi:MAG: hypothetical protein PHV48_06350 [Candidatus Omnitrophica bacterium]|nr:hypothetical protein [Candidatus Omnitrophota bacterium]
MESKERKIAVSASELVRELQEGIINPKALDVATKEGYTKVLNDNEYDSIEIAKLLKINIRSIQRYIKKIKKDNALKVGRDFQKETLGEVVDLENKLFKKLSKLLESESLSTQEQLQISSQLHKINIDKIMILEKVGYLSIDQGKYDLQHPPTSSIPDSRERRAFGKRWMLCSRLTPDQRRSIVDYYSMTLYYHPYLEKEIRKITDEQINNAISENEKHRKDTARGVGPFKQLYCKVFVINRLCKN